MSVTGGAAREAAAAAAREATTVAAREAAQIVLRDSAEMVARSAAEATEARIAAKTAQEAAEAAAKSAVKDIAETEGWSTAKKFAAGALGLGVVLASNMPSEEQCIQKCINRRNPDTCQGKDGEDNLNCPIPDPEGGCDDYCETICTQDNRSALAWCSVQDDPVGGVANTLTSMVNSPLGFWDTWGTIIMVLCGLAFIPLILGMYKYLYSANPLKKYVEKKVDTMGKSKQGGGKHGGRRKR